MTSDLAVWLLEASLATTIAIAAILGVRWPLRAAGGAGAAYLLWATVPLVAIAVLLPASVIPVSELRLTIPRNLDGTPTATAVIAARDFTGWLLLVWLTGALWTIAWLARQQRRFLSTLGRVRSRSDGFLQSEACVGLPAVIGWRSHIVLPADFESRYDAHERELVLCHERVHQRRGDLPAAAIAATLRAVFWFNPLVHIAAARFREDQELACDAAVLRRHPASRRRYGDALLKTHLAAQPLPVGCHWSGPHPLRERIAMLKRPVPSSSRRIAGLALALAAACTGATFAWAAQPRVLVPAGRIGLEMEVKIDDGAARILTGVLTPGVPHTFELSNGDEQWRIETTVGLTAAGEFDLVATIARDGEVVGEPRMLFTDDGAAIGIGSEQADGSFKGVTIELRADSRDGLSSTAVADAADAVDGAASRRTAGVAGTRTISLEKPKYPPDALARGEGGVVILEVHVSEVGRALESRYVADGSTVPESSPFVQASLDAAVNWELPPAMENGLPIEGWMRVPVTFEPREGKG